MPPLFTVITVTYNAAPLIGRTIESVESQTLESVEHVIVDGNSRDETLTLVHHYQERNSLRPRPRNITCLSEPDRGLYDAMNKAIDLATGRYLVFLNAGDKFHTPQTLAQAAACLDPAAGEKAQPAVIYGQTDLVDAEGRFIRPRRLQAPERLSRRSFLKGMLVCHQSFYVRADLARQTPYDLRYRFSADFDWCIRIMRLAARRKLPLCNARAVLTDYLSEGLTTQNHKASLRERFVIMCRHYGLPATLASHAYITGRALLKK